MNFEEIREKQNLLKQEMKSKIINYNWHDADTSIVEAMLSRGDRRIGAVIEEVWRNGGRLEAWTDYFRLDRWYKAFESCGIDTDFYALRQREEDEVLPWDMIDCGVSKEYLTNPEIEDPSYGQDRSPYIEDVREKYGDHAASEVENLLGQASALFAGGSIDEAGKDAFFQALVEVYAQSKVDAKEKFGRKRKSDR